MIRKAIEEALDKILILFFKNEMTEIEVLKNVNKAVHYNSCRETMWELFFVQALRMDKVPKVQSFIMSLFGSYTEEDFFKFQDTRQLVLDKIGLEKSSKLYEEWQIKNSRDELSCTQKSKDEMKKIIKVILDELHEQGIK